MGKRVTAAEQLAAKEVAIANLRLELTSMRDRLVAADLQLSDIPKWQARVDELEVESAAMRGQRDANADSLAKVQKELDSSKNTCDYHRKGQNKAEEELEQVHLILDTVEGAPAKTFTKEYGEGTRNVSTRLVGAFMAVQRGAK